MINKKKIDVEYIHYKDTLDCYFAIKQFCGDNVEITIETCAIDTYVSVKLNGTIVPVGSDIVKHPNGTFSIYDSSILKKYE